MTTLDWTIVCIPLLLVLCVGLYARTYVRSVADFLSANRSAGRYLLCISGAELNTGAVVFVASFEVFMKGGFAYGWMNNIVGPIGVILTIFGFVGYRFRQTRAMTLAQFFEIRYNKSFRLFTGLLAFFAGMLNFGIIPAIGARTMVYFFGLPEMLHFGSWSIDTYVVLMACFLSLAAFVATSGGVVTVMLVNTLEGVISQVFYLIIICTVLSMFTWTQMHDVLLAQPKGQSLVNPFDTDKNRDFNIWTVLMGVVAAEIGRGCWQNASAYKSAALTPHEGRMSGVLTTWMNYGKGATVTLLALAAVTFLRSPDFASGAAHVQTVVQQISNAKAQEQMVAPIALALLLPVGVKGLFCVIMLMGIFGGDATHLHSWGSIFVQDVLVPKRKKPFGPRAHLWALRCSIIGVACFAFFFGTFFHLVDYIQMWWSVTQAIFTGGAGAAVIGGLYWKKGTAQGAWAGFITGSVLCLAGIVMQQIYVYHKWDFTLLGLPLNGVRIGCIGSVAAVIVYIVVSRLTFKEDFNLDRMLHRGAYSGINQAVETTQLKHYKFKLGWSRFIGIDDNFTRGDRWIAYSVAGWTFFTWGLLLTILTWNLIAPWASETWASYFHVMSIGVPVFFAFVTGIWFTWGGLKDMRALFRRLRTEKVNTLDDGTVVNGQNLDEKAVTKGRG